MQLFASLTWAALLTSAAATRPLHAQDPAGSIASPTEAPAAGLDSLVRLALGVSPAIHSALAGIRAADAAVHQAGARPDPMLMA
ncbi:MAG: hypothetical protein ACREL6_05325, partial [Gemmatimonadales bacterium]